MQRALMVLAACVAASVVAAQPSDVVVVIDNGSSRQPIARFTGAAWVEIPGSLDCSPQSIVPSTSPRVPIQERLVVTGEASVEAARRLLPAEAEWRTIEPVIAQLFQKRERELRLTASHLASAQMAIDWVYATEKRAGVLAVYYFEASKRVPDPGTAPEEDPKGTLRIVVSGWLREGALGAGALAKAASNAVVPLGSKSELRWEQDQLADRPEARRPDLVPIGILQQGTQFVWVMKGQIGDIGWFTLYDAGQSGVRTLVRADASRC